MRSKNYRVAELALGEKNEYSFFASIETIMRLIETNPEFARFELKKDWCAGGITAIAYNKHGTTFFFWRNFPSSAPQNALDDDRLQEIFCEFDEME